jgi:hypothetical protein
MFFNMFYCFSICLVYSFTVFQSVAPTFPFIDIRYPISDIRCRGGVGWGGVALLDPFWPYSSFGSPLLLADYGVPADYGCQLTAFSGLVGSTPSTPSTVQYCSH